MFSLDVTVRSKGGHSHKGPVQSWQLLCPELWMAKWEDAHCVFRSDHSNTFVIGTLQKAKQVWRGLNYTVFIFQRHISTVLYAQVDFHVSVLYVSIYLYDDFLFLLLLLNTNICTFSSLHCQNNLITFTTSASDGMTWKAIWCTVCSTIHKSGFFKVLPVIQSALQK